MRTRGKGTSLESRAPDGRARRQARSARRARVVVAAAICVLGLPGLLLAAAQEDPSGSTPAREEATPAASPSAKRLTVERDDTTIVIAQESQNATGARFLLRNPNCEDDTFTSIFFAPPPGENRTMLDGDTTLISRLVIVTEPREAEGESEQSLDLRDADVTFNRPGCIETLEPVQDPRVELRQGRSTVSGSRFLLDRNTDLGTMEGPVTLERSAQGDSPALSANADGLELDIDTEVTTLIGNVEIRSEDRVSRADRLELREDEGVAILTGNPASTQVGDDVVEGSTLRYYLDTNDVVVEGSVKGTFDLPE